MRRLAATVLLLLATPAAAQARSPFTAGPPLLRAPAPAVPELQGGGVFRAAPLLVSGTDAYRDGEYLYQDYLLDDHGADTLPVGNLLKTDKPDPLSTGDIAASTGGDVRYATAPRFAGNAADIAELRMALTPRQLVLRVTLRSAVAPDATVVGIGADTDRSGGAPVAWPLGAGITSPGLDAFVTAWGTGGEVRRLPGGAPHRLAPGAVTMDLERNQMTIRIPRTALDPGTATWRLVAGAGAWDGHGWMTPRPASAPTATAPASGNPLAGAPAVMNLAFRFHEPQVKDADATHTTFPGIGNWFEDGQARDLAQRTSGDAGADVDFARMQPRARRGHTTRWVHAPGRIQARVLGSGLPVAEGVRATYPEYGSRLVPYLLVRPSGTGTTAAPAGVTLDLHSFGGTYTQHAIFSPRQLTQLGDQRGNVVVTPLSRSLGGGYAGLSEADTFEVLRDVADHVRVDPERVSIAGYSMGGFGTYRLATAYPDLFARAFTGVGPAGTGRPGLERNVRWVPFLNWVAVADELVPYPTSRQAQARMEAAGMRSELWSFAGEHFTLAIEDGWGEARDFLGQARAVRDPWRVTYAFADEDARRDLGLSRDAAYWVSGLAAADPRRLASVDARSLAFGERDAPVQRVSGSKPGLGAYPQPLQVGAGVPAPPVAIEGTRWGPAPRVTPERVLELDLANLRAATVDLARARLGGRAPVEVRLRADHPVTVLLRNGPTGRGTCVLGAPGIRVCRIG